MGVEAAGRAGEDACGDHGQHGVAVGADARGLGQRLVLLHRAQRTTDARGEEPRGGPERGPRQYGYQIIVVTLGGEREALGREIEWRHAGQPHGSLRQVGPVGGHEANHLGKSDGHQHEIGAAELQRQHAEEPARDAGDKRPGRQRPERREPVLNTQETRSIGADAEERRVPEIELARGQEQIHSRREQKKDSGHDEQVEIVVVDTQERKRQPQRAGRGPPERAGSHRVAKSVEDHARVRGLFAEALIGRGLSCRRDPAGARAAAG